jgi:hypothetical protein
MKINKLKGNILVKYSKYLLQIKGYKKTSTLTKKALE